MNADVAARATHWDTVYADRVEEQRSWSQPVPAVSLRLVGEHPGAVVDVGAGGSRLVDGLLDAGREHVTLVDVSAEALAQVRARLGHDERVQLVVADLLAWRPDRAYGVWHDRAVLHFLTDPEERAAYVALAAATVAPGGVAVLGVFGPEGPTTCSGLPTARSSSSDLAALFGQAFELVHDETEVHHTPWDAPQQFTWVVLRRRPGGGA